MRIHLELSGDSGGPVVLWLHGALVNGWMWEHQVRALGHLHSIVVDLPGHGKSVSVPWTSFADTAAVVLEAVDAAVGTQTTIHIVGMSLGSLVAQELMARSPERIGRVVLTGSLARPVPRVMTWANLVVGALTQLPGAESLVGFALQLPPEAREEFHEAGLALDRASFFRLNAQLAERAVPEGLERFEGRVLLLAGEREQRLILDSLADLLALLPDATGRLAPGAHHPWSGELPELFNATVEAWLSGSELPEALLPFRT